MQDESQYKPNLNENDDLLYSPPGIPWPPPPGYGFGIPRVVPEAQDPYGRPRGVA